MTRRLPRTVLAIVLVLGLAAGGCASTGTGPAQEGSAPGQRSGAMVRGGETGLGISGAVTPPELKAAALAPYALPSPPDCAAMASELRQLDDLLGPDVDVLAVAETRSAAMGRAANRAIVGAVRGAIPYRWVLRWMTQAGKLDRELRLAILAATARRGYLKGVRLGLACPVT
ncbi:MAG: hypothetical protein Q8N10_03270 [Phenylobacterium sp.]|uniref:hypothetical protein n=1 Tax=Phenylobacterium sp. TaxID=1871053 RepID=UPI00272105A1|nr:hypothetical protein [Phenylobacterium sp.]MDO8912290.1 hypothetical protein [Phenylobacterium sp.]MDP3099502.1 hypothetical protein [Phenylobacterium sp.]